MTELVQRIALHHDPYIGYEVVGHSFQSDPNDPDFMPAAPLSVVHDIMEHFDHHKGLVEHEVEAFGAILAGRYMGHYFSDLKPNPYRIYDLSEMASEVGTILINQLAILERPPIHTDVLEAYNGDYIDEVVEVAEKAFDAAVEEYGDDEYHLNYLESNKEGLIEMVETRMKNGIVYFERKFPDTDPYGIAETFLIAEQHLDRLMKNAEFGYSADLYIDTRRYMSILQNEKVFGEPVDSTY